ncbi:MAG: DUF4012 domain-containing protein [candidate division WWE3 bacterium]|nr:DUF4012 domain-containing protein [candidate division WWE3 bacterium]
MPKFQKGDIPRVLINNAVSFLGLNLSSELTLNGFDVTSKQDGRPFDFLVYLNDPLLEPLDAVGRFKEFLDVAVSVGSPLVLVTALIPNPTDIFIEQLLQDRHEYPQWSIVRLPQILGPEAPSESLGILGHFLISAKKGLDIVVPSDGLSKIPYLNYYDAVSFLVKLLTTVPLPHQQTFKVLPAEILSELEIAYLIKSLVKNTNLKVVFGSDNAETLDNLNAGTVTLSSTIPLRESLREMLNSVPFERPVMTTPPEKRPVLNRLPPPPATTSISPRPIFKRTLPLVTLGVILAALLFFIVYPLGKTAYFGYFGKQHLEKSIGAVSSLDFNLGAIESYAAESDLEIATASLNSLPNVAFLSSPKKFMRGGSLVASALYHINIAALPFTKPVASYKEIIDAIGKMQTAVGEINLAAASFKGSNTDYEKTIAAYLPNLTLVGNSLPLVPSLLGYDTPKTYLILFQNPMELRATGGFIGSYAKVTFSMGKMSALTFDDIYNPDGQLLLKNLAAPVPPEMKSAFPAMKQLFMRDSNFWVSFPTSAKTISDLYTLATAEKIDGVAALDLSFVGKLLDVTGPLYLGTYDETIGSNNLFERTQYHSEGNYFEGSPQKKNFLQLLGNKLLEKLASLSTADKIKILPVLASSLSEKHLMLATFDSSQQILAENKWDGRLEATSNTDALLIVDTNTGGNKANYWVQQGANYEVKNTYRQGSLEGFLTINYTNTSKAGSWPSGDYADYVRVYVPKDTFLNDASTEIMPGLDTAPTKPIISVGTESGFTVFGYNFILAAGSNLTLKLHYTLPKELNLFDSSKNYNLRLIKQPGVDGEPFSFKFNKPFGKTLSVPVGFKTDGDSVVFNTLLKTDQYLQIPLN